MNHSLKTILFPLVALSLPFAVNAAINITYDFESGYSGSTDYGLYSGTGEMGSTLYSVTTSPSNVHPQFLTFGDHTTGDGNMMVVNAATSSGAHFFQSASFDVLNDETYTFSFWGRSALSPDTAPGNIEFQVWNNTLSSSVSAGSSVIASDGNAGWQQYEVQWINNTGNTTVYLRLEDLELSAAGNDFAIDDISITAVPEPESFGLLLGLSVGLALFWRRGGLTRIFNQLFRSESFFSDLVNMLSLRR